jgi:hypothetical protein
MSNGARLVPAFALAAAALAPFPARALSCGGPAGADLPGNRRCATPAEQQLVNKTINGPWKTAACAVRLPLGWHTRRNGPKEPTLILPDSTSLLAEQNFWASVGVTMRSPTREETQPPAPAAEPPADDAATDDAMVFRYAGAADEGRGEGTEEYEGETPVSHDPDHREWHADYTIKALGDESFPTGALMHLTRYACGASDRMSIDVFSSMCTAVWERMMLASEQPAMCPDNDDDAGMR